MQFPSVFPAVPFEKNADISLISCVCFCLSGTNVHWTKLQDPALTRCRGYSHSCMQTVHADLLAFIFPYGRQFSLLPPTPPPLSVIWEPRSTVPRALALNRFPRVTRPGRMAWREFSKPAAQEARVSAVLYPPARYGYSDVSQGIKGRGKERQVEETLVTLLSAASWTTQPLHFTWFSVHG